MTSRRSLLRRGGYATLATVAGILVIPPPQSSAITLSTDIDRVDGSPFPESPVDPADLPIARYQYRFSATGYEPTAPINVLIELPDGYALTDVEAVFEDAGWSTTIEEYVRYARPDDGTDFTQQDFTAAETYAGIAGRLHVRCWAFDGFVSMQAHVDNPARPYHTIDSYERARHAIESLFAAADWTVYDERLFLDNSREPDHDGNAAIIRPGERE